MAQVASKFTLFTHHAKTFPDLVTALRNSMLRAGVFKSEQTAAEQVVQVLNFDVHLVKDFRGRRYIERITKTQDSAKLIELFKEIIIKSYGIKSDDGRRFIKSPEIT